VKQNHSKINRRVFLKTTGAIGLSSIVASGAGINTPNEPNTSGQSKKSEFPQVPRRKLGKTGINVPSMSLGCVFNTLDNQIILRKALQYGVNLWDTAHYYIGGNSELGIGKFLSRNPQARKELFIVTKPLGGPKTAKDLEKSLQLSLKRMNTDYIDLYYGFKALYNPKHLTDELKQWAQSAKKRKLIRFFGFCTHTNMAKCLANAGPQNASRYRSMLQGRHWPYSNENSYHEYRRTAENRN
jgi:aryl-alcohol dehydrogenase-like predicted oxidoreductase